MTDTAKTKSAMRRSEPKRNRKPPSSRLSEATVWQPIRDGWRRLYGSFHGVGVSIEWHDFELPHTFEWSRSFHPDSLELCLNLAGHGQVRCADKAVGFEPLTAGFYLPGGRALHACRDANQQHRFITMEFSPRFLRDHLAPSDGALHPLVEKFVHGMAVTARLGDIHRLTTAQERRVVNLRNPPVVQGARLLWYRGEVLQFMAEFFFERRGEDELFCDRQKRLARERVDRVVALLRKNLVEPLSLEEVGCQVGCSPFHLSRTFSREMGMSIPQYLRKLRMERAAELLRSGKYNVTEAALEVGYSSLSHFSQAFCQTIGCCPGLYPLKRATPGCAEAGACPAAQNKNLLLNEI
jgi:AraC-like DNA-binding protein